MITFTHFLENQVFNKMLVYLNQLAASYQLIAHQTFDDSAASIMKTGFGKNGLHGTALFSNPQQIIQTASTMAGTGGQAAIHKGANSLVVLAFPKQIIQQLNIRSLQDLDDHLVDIYGQGKLQTIGLPPNYIVGYFNNGQFFANGQFRPDSKQLM